MSKVKLLALTVILTVIVGTIGWVYVMCRLDAISPASYAQVRLGMTQQEAEAAIGLPAGDYYGRHLRSGTLSGPFVSLLRESGIPERSLPERGYGVTRDGRHRVEVVHWCGNTYTIWIAFDQNTGRAVGTYLCRVFHPRDPALTVLADDIRVALRW